MTNVLYFESVGGNYEENALSNVGNYRIRTAFKNLDGVAYYLELSRSYRNGYEGNKRKVTFDWAIGIDHLFKIEDRISEQMFTFCSPSGIWFFSVFLVD